jgi:hypothetical protein
MLKEYILKHKNIDVASLNYDKQSKLFVKINKLFCPEHLPFIYSDLQEKNLLLINRWFEYRGIPGSREGYNELLSELKTDYSKELSLMSMGLNLTDHYWVCPANDIKDWHEVNFFENKYSEYIGKLIFNYEKSGEVNLLSPDLSSGGHLKKRWVNIDNKNILLKDGSGDARQEPYNEVIASYIMQKLNIDHVDYYLVKDDKNGCHYSACECMIDTDTEFVTGFLVYLYNNDKFNGKYNDYIKVCVQNGIANARTEIDKMICIDYLIGNIDRHPGNFGIIRNANTLEWIKTASIFDNGNSLWYDVQNTGSISAVKNTISRSFSRSNTDNLALIDFPEWYVKNTLNNTGEFADSVLSKNKDMEEKRISVIAACLQERCNLFEEKLWNGLTR